MIVLRILSWTLDFIGFLVSPFGFVALVSTIFYGIAVFRPEFEMVFVESLLVVGLVYFYQMLDEHFVD